MLIARENLLYTFIDYYQDKFNETPSIELQKKMAKKHNGIYTNTMDWKNGKPIRFVDIASK